MNRILLIIGIGLFFINPLSAQVKVNTELKGFINQSFTYFPKIKEVENTVKTAEEKLTLTELNKKPDIDFEAGYAYVKPKIEIPLGGQEFQFAPVHNLSTAVTGSYALYDFGRIKANVTKAKNDIQLAKHNTDYVKSQLANQVAVIYYNIVYLQKAISIQDSVIHFYEENKVLTENRLKNGDALKIDVMNLQTNIDAEENRKVDLINSLDKQFNLLEYTTGLKKADAKNFDFDVNYLNAEEGTALAQKNNPDFLLAEDKIKQAKQEVEIAKLTDKPMVGLHAATGYKNGYVPNVNELIFNYNAGISFTMPIYNFGKTKQHVKLQESLVKQNELSEISLAGTYKKDIEQALTDIKTNIERIRNTKSQLEAAKTAQQITASRYKNGVATNLDVTAAATNVQKAALTQLQYDYQLCLAKVELAKLIGYEYWKN